MSIGAHASRIFACSLRQNASISASQLFTISGSLRNIPSPLQGASTRILSKKFGSRSAIRSGVSLITIALRIPASSTFFRSVFALPALMSFATRSPVPPSLAPSCVVFPPGAAQRSSTLSPSPIGSVAAGLMALGSCK